MEAIGGYFGLEDCGEGLFPHRDGVLLNTGRNALEYILRSIGDVKRVYLPYYTCEVVLDPLKKLNIPWIYYHIDTNFEIAEDVNLSVGEYIIANNYFGLKDTYIQTLASKYGDRLIVDCAQAFFARPLSGIKSFYSMRKFVGVADGGVAYLGNLPDDRVEVNEFEHSDEHNSHLLKRKQFGAEAGFADYRVNEKKLDNQPIRWMSTETKQILDHIDYEKVMAKRCENFAFLHNKLKRKNFLQFMQTDSFACPMVYLYWTDDASLRQRLIENKVFVATYWPNVQEWTNDGMLERQLTERLLPIPCDQRYGKDEMNRIIEIIQNGH